MIDERNVNLVASFLVLLDDGKVLMQRRCNTSHCDGQYGLPSGKVDEGETFTQAIIREVAEEIGVVLKEDYVRVAHLMHNNSGDVHEWVNVFFLAREYDGEIRNMEPEKCDDLDWFPLDDLPENTIPYVRHALACISKSEFYSECGW